MKPSEDILGFLKEQLLFSIYEGRYVLFVVHVGRYEREFISVDADTNTPYQQWEDAGNMHGNRTLKITWEKVESFDPTKFAGINEHNWKNYIPSA